MIRAIHHPCVSTADFDRSVAFYRDVVGCEPVWEDEVGGPVLDALLETDGARMRCALLRLGPAFMEIQQYLKPPGEMLADPEERRQFHFGLSHICLDVVDCDAEYERMSAAGMRFIAPPREIEGIAKITFGRDPDGNLIELQEILVPDHELALSSTARA